MNRKRKSAARIALFLEAAGITPVVRGSNYQEQYDNLAKQFLNLDADIRRKARIEGRRRIRTEGIVSTALRLIPARPLVYTRSEMRRAKRRQRRQLKRAALLEKLSRRPADTPPCPKCRSARSLPKRSWPSWEMAEEVRSRQNDPGLLVYPCPIRPGYWHLGHLRYKE